MEPRAIDVELKSSQGPRVVVRGEWERAEVERELPAGWTIGDHWSNGTKLDNGSWAYPIVQA